jgi:DNA-binding NarL/FixJ family response regulator
MPAPEKPPGVMSLMGPLRRVMLPEALGFENPRELGRAMLAWKFDLSRTDVRLLELVAEGLTNAEIAERLAVADENTVKQRLKILFRKLGVHNRVQATNVAVQFGIGWDFV